MITIIENLIPANTITEWRETLSVEPWESGSVTAGSQAREVKTNLQLPITSEAAQQIGAEIRAILSSHPTFVSACLPKKVLLPRFNCYQQGGQYGVHIDSALMQDEHHDWLRTDISATLFLSEPNSYEGGELCIETAFGSQEIKLNAGDIVLYPSSSLHQVMPVTKGARISAFFWIESLVQSQEQRALLFDLDQSIQGITAELGAGNPQVTSLSGIYHNLLRKSVST